MYAWCLTVSSYDKCLNLLHSGSDWDFDGFSIIFDLEYVATANQVRNNFREVNLKDDALNVQLLLTY